MYKRIKYHDDDYLMVVHVKSIFIMILNGHK